MVPSDTCGRCTATDTLKHLLTACGEGRTIWQYTKPILARVFVYWSPKRRSAILWVIANVVIFGIQQHTNLTLHDYMDFLHRTRWKLMGRKCGRDLVGNCLTVLDTY